MVCDDQWLSENYYGALKGLGGKIVYCYLLNTTTLIIKYIKYKTKYNFVIYLRSHIF